MKYNAPNLVFRIISIEIVAFNIFKSTIYFLFKLLIKKAFNLLEPTNLNPF